MKWPKFKSAPGSLEDLRHAAQHTVRHEGPHTSRELEDRHIVRNEYGLNNDQPPRGYSAQPPCLQQAAWPQA